jgi:hypothetical protein
VLCDEVNRADDSPSSQLAMGVLGALFGGTYLAVRGSNKKPVQTPPINASSPDEADFIQYAKTRRNLGNDWMLTLGQELLEGGRRERGEGEALNATV